MIKPYNINSHNKYNKIVLFTLFIIFILFGCFCKNIYADEIYTYYFDDADYFIQHFNNGNGANSQLINSIGTISVYDENNRLLYSYGYGNSEYPKCMYHKTSTQNRFTTDVLTSSNIKNVHSQISIINQTDDVKFISFSHYLTLSNNDLTYNIYRNGNYTDGGTTKYVKNGYIKLVSNSNLNSIFGDFTEPLHAVITPPLPTPTLTLDGTLLKFSNFGDELNNNKVIRIYDINNNLIANTTYSQYNITYPNGYYITIYDRQNNVESEHSNIVYYALSDDLGDVSRLSTPTYIFENQTFKFDHSYGFGTNIAVYRNNQLYDMATIPTFSNPYYKPMVNGTYKFMAYKGNNYSEVSDSYTIDYIDDSNVVYNPTKPILNGVNNYDIIYDTGTEPTDGNIISWLKYYIDNFNGFISTIFNGILDLFKNAVESINSLFPYVQQFVNSFGDLFAFVPPQIRDIFVSCIAISILFAIIKFIKN